MNNDRIVGQKKLMSFAETAFSTGIGFVVALMAQLWIMEQFGINYDPMRDVVITCFFTVISLVRGYLVRRFFNWIHVRSGEKIAL